MDIRLPPLLLGAGLALAAFLALSASLSLAKELEGDAITKSLLRKAEYEHVAISPDGGKLAIARRGEQAVEVTILNLADNKVLIRFDPGYKGEMMMKESAETSKEDLGRQTVDGVAATGTRTTWTIAAGAIGNLQPIKIVSEQWFSPDLQLLVLTKHSDPRTGENTYRLQNIVRAEPDRSLFTVPPDYTLKESGIRKE